MQRSGYRLWLSGIVAATTLAVAGGVMAQPGPGGAEPAATDGKRLSGEPSATEPTGVGWSLGTAVCCGTGVPVGTLAAGPTVDGAELGEATLPQATTNQQLTPTAIAVDQRHATWGA